MPATPRWGERDTADQGSGSASTIHRPYYLYPDHIHPSPRRNVRAHRLSKGRPPLKFRSERDALVDMLATAGRAVGGRGGSSPVLLGVLVTCAGNTLSVTGTDLDLTIVVTGEVIGIEDGSCVVPARLATDIVRRLEPGAVTFADGGEQITISAARSTFKLHTYPVVEFPPVGRTKEPITHLPEVALGEAVRQVVRAASHDDGRPAVDRRAGLPHRGVAPPGGDRLVPHGDARPARNEPHPRRGGPPRPRPGALRAAAAARRSDHRGGRRRAASASPPAPARSRSGRATSRSAPACWRGAIRTTSS